MFHCSALLGGLVFFLFHCSARFVTRTSEERFEYVRRDRSCVYRSPRNIVLNMGRGEYSIGGIFGSLMNLGEKGKLPNLPYLAAS